MFSPLLSLVLLAAVPCHDGSPKVAQAQLEKPAPTDKQARAGVVHDAVTTKSKKAQAAYDRGLALFHAYDWIRSARSFHEALRADKDLAMAWLGLSLVREQMDDREGARAAWKEAVARAPRASERERARIDAWGAALEGLSDREAADRYAGYRAALDAALAKWPDDAELLLMRGNASLLPQGYSPYQSAESIPYFERVLAKSPDHPGANHYMVHALENEGRFADAAPFGAALARIAPGAPHLVHMDGHGLLRRGKVMEAIARFEEVDRMGAAIRAAERIAVADDWHHSHNLALLASAYRHQGRMKDAEKTLRRLAGVAPVGEDAMLDRKDLAAFLLARGRWPDARKAAEALAKSELPETRAIAHAIAGQAALASGDRAAADERWASASTEMSNVYGELMVTRQWLVSLWVNELALALALADDRDVEAETIADELIANHRALRGPDGWVQALFRLERIGVLAREAGHWPLAAKVAAAMVEHDPEYAGTRLAVAAVARHEGKAELAAREEAAAKKAWSKGDPGLFSP